MTQRLFGAAALILALLMSNAAAAQARNDTAASAFAWYPWWGYYYQQPNPCMVWDGYQWLNMCWRSRTFVRPPWARFRR
jgi:hypothetical protein